MNETLQINLVSCKCYADRRPVPGHRRALQHKRPGLPHDARRLQGADVIRRQCAQPAARQQLQGELPLLFPHCGSPVFCFSCFLRLKRRCRHAAPMRPTWRTAAASK